MTSAVDRRSETIANKLPEITAAFWIMKITATTLGETGGDWLSMTMKVGYLVSALIFFAFFVVALGAQLLADRYRPLLYWSVIVATSTAGTALSDYMDRTLALGYAAGATILVTILLVVLGLWRWTSGSVDVNKIRSRRSEVFYWLAILVSNTLGTALGDFLSDDSGLGFFGSWLVISAVLAVILTLHYATRLPKVLLFWMAFILTRPFGATFGDVLTKAPDKGGLDFGRDYASLVLLAILLLAIATVDKTKLVLRPRPRNR